MAEPRKLRAGIVNATFGDGATIVEPCNLYGCSIGDGSFVGPFSIGNDVSIGTDATILPVAICDRDVIGAGAVVTKDIPVPRNYAGNPARLIRKL